MADKKSQPCNKCGCPILWDVELTPPPALNRTKNGWWKEDLSKNIHNLDRCINFKNSKEFMEPQSVQNAQNNPNVTEAPSPLKMPDVQILTDDELELVNAVGIQICEIKQKLRSTVKPYHLDDSNPASIGQMAEIAFKAIIKRREKNG